MVGPKECPKCGNLSLEIRVVAWWAFEDGEPIGQGDGYLEPTPNSMAECQACYHRWMPRFANAE